MVLRGRIQPNEEEGGRDEEEGGMKMREGGRETEIGRQHIVPNMPLFGMSQVKRCVT